MKKKQPTTDTLTAENRSNVHVQGKANRHTQKIDKRKKTTTNEIKT